MTKLLFDNFPPVSSKEWKQKIQFDLNGADYNDALVWTSNEGIQVKPFYHRDDFDATLPTHNTHVSKFKIGEIIHIEDDAAIANKQTIDAIKNGAESIKFIGINNNFSIKSLLHSITTDEIEFHFEIPTLSLDFFKRTQLHYPNIRFFFNLDVIGNLAKTGNWFNNYNSDFDLVKNAITELNHKNTSLLSINLSLYENSGANIVQQLAYGMAHANEYFNHLENTISKDLKSEILITFNISIGSNYFFEIAKLKALRLLFTSITNAYSLNYNCHIIAAPTKRNKTIYEANNNMLRTTTECMSAILGGADTVYNLAYDSIFRKQNNFGNRIARNQLLILKNEAYFNAVNNPSDGSYYIESLTSQLSEKALILFKDIEIQGGFLKQLKEGTIQRKIKENAHREHEQFNSGKKIILGSNKYINENEKIKDELELYPFTKINKRKTLIEPIIEKRLTEKLEQKRLKKE